MNKEVQNFLNSFLLITVCITLVLSCSNNEDQKDHQDYNSNDTSTPIGELKNFLEDDWEKIDSSSDWGKIETVYDTILQ